MGFDISGGSIKRVIASRTIDKQRAIRKTALKKAPRISALSHCSKVRIALAISCYLAHPKGIFVGARSLCSLNSPKSNE